MVETNLAKQRSRFILTCPTSLACIFHNLRVNRGITAKKLSKKLGVGEVYISQVECGFKKPSLRYWLGCAEEFGASPGWTKTKWLNEESNRIKERLKKRIGLAEWV